MNRVETFSIRQMVELTGLSEFTIRGWENRYSAFHPRRTETGRREYLKTDVERALLLRELLKRGHKIGHVASLSNPKLKNLFEETDAEAQRELKNDSSRIAVEAIELMALQEWDRLECLIKSARFKTPKKLVHDLCLPLLRALSANVSANLVSISQEHVFSSFLKEKIYMALNDLGPTPKNKKDRTRFVLAAPEGDYHETGLLLAHLLVRAHGLTSLYLGPHTPARDLAETALRFNASHVLIVSTVGKKGGAKQEPLTYVSEVQKKTGPKMQILFAGIQAPHGEAPHPSLSILRDFETLEALLDRWGGHDD